MFISAMYRKNIWELYIDGIVQLIHISPELLNESIHYLTLYTVTSK